MFGICSAHLGMFSFAHLQCLLFTKSFNEAINSKAHKKLHETQNNESCKKGRKTNSENKMANPTVPPPTSVNGSFNNGMVMMTSAEFLVRKAARQIGFGDDDTTLERNNRVSVIVDMNNQNRLDHICHRLTDEFLFEDWQLPALEASQWKELGAPMGLMTAIRVLVEYPDAIQARCPGSGIGGRMSKELSPQGRQGSNADLSNRLSEVTDGTNVTRSQRLPSQGQDALLPSILSAANEVCPPAPGDNDIEDDSELFDHGNKQIHHQQQEPQTRKTSSSTSFDSVQDDRQSMSHEEEKGKRNSGVEVQFRGYGERNTPEDPPISRETIETDDDDDNKSDTSEIIVRPKKGKRFTLFTETERFRRESEWETTAYTRPTSLWHMFREHIQIGSVGVPFMFTNQFIRGLIHGKSAEEFKAHAIFVMELNVVVSALLTGAAIEMWGIFPQDSVVQTGEWVDIPFEEYGGEPVVPYTIALMFHTMNCMSALLQFSLTLYWAAILFVAAAVSPSQFTKYGFQTMYAHKFMTGVSVVGQLFFVLTLGTLFTSLVWANTTSTFLRRYMGTGIPVLVIVPSIIFYSFLTSYLSKTAFHGMLLTSRKANSMSAADAAANSGREGEDQDGFGTVRKKEEYSLWRSFHEHKIGNTEKVLDEYTNTHINLQRKNRNRNRNRRTVFPTGGSYSDAFDLSRVSTLPPMAERKIFFGHQAIPKFRSGLLGRSKRQHSQSLFDESFHSDYGAGTVGTRETTQEQSATSLVGQNEA